MFAFLVGSKSAEPIRVAFKPAMVSLVLLALAGCASNSDRYASDGQQPATQVAHAVAVDVEDDGLPSQAPPPMRIRDVPDDPSEPFSKNYGGSHPYALHEIYEGVTTPADDAPTPIPDDLPVAFREKLVAAFSSDE